MLTYHTGDQAGRGGLDLIISLTPDQADALGTSAALLAEELDTALVGLAALRTGRDPEAPDPYANLGPNAARIARRLDTIPLAITPAAPSAARPAVPAVGRSLKDQPVTAGRTWDMWLLRDLATLRTSLAGITAAAIRAHHAHGGTYGEVATAQGVPRPTAQRRRDTVLDNPPSPGELWATTLPAHDDDQEAPQS